MTSSALTPGARRARAAGQPTTEQPRARPAAKAPPGRTAATTAAAAAAGSSDHPGSVRRPSAPRAPRAPRRVSGPVSGLVRDRVITGPQRGGRDAPGAPRARPRTARREPLPARAVAYIRALPDHALLDRIIRGRAWIPLLGVLLAGIVAMQVEVLKLGASIGRSIERGTALQSRNEILRASVAQLGDDARIERLATGMGMVMPAPAQITFLAARGANDVQQAINDIHPPDPTGFTAQLQAADLASGVTDSSTATATPANTATATPANTATAPLATSSVVPAPASVTGAQATPSTSSSAAGTPTTSSTPITPAQTGTTSGQGAGSTAATAPTTTGAPIQTGAASTPPATGAPVAGQTGSSGGAATPTGG